MEDKKSFRYNGLTPFDGSVALLTGMIAMLIISLALAFFIPENNTYSLVYSFLSQIGFALSAFCFAFSACKRDCKGIKNYTLNAFYSLGYTKKVKPLLLVLCFFLPIFSIFAFLPVSTLIEFVFFKIGYVNNPGYADYTKNPQMLILCIFALCVFPAFGEETIMRGALLHGLRQKGTVFAILASSTLFALMHGSPTQFIHQFLIGSIMAYIVLLTDCIWYSIIFHFLNNFTVIIYEYAYVHSGATYSIPLWAYFVMFIVGIIGLAFLLFFFTKNAVKNTDFDERLKDEVAEKGKIKGLCKALFDTTEYKYKSYDKTKCYMLYITTGVLGVLWLFNTIAGWLK